METQKLSSIPVRILLIDRHKDVCEMFELLLASMGYVAKGVTSPEEAMLTLSNEIPDIIYSSVVFDSTDGFELAAKLRQLPELNRTVLIALTGLQFPGIQHIAKSVGFDDYLCKPVAMELLLKSIGKVDDYRARRPRQAGL